MEFSQARINFNQQYANKAVLDKSLCTVDGKFISNISLRDVHGEKNEEFYKWEFIYSMIQSGRVPSRDYIGAEIYFPKGNIHSAPIKIDSVVFSDISWLYYYRKQRENPADVESLQKVRELAIEVIEYKRNDKTIEQVFSSQVRAAMKEPDSPFVLGVYYETGRLFLFKKINNEITRFDNSLSFPTILNVGYKKKTSKRTVKFDNDYALDPDTFETITNDEGESVLNEDFSQIIKEFKEWCVSQELDLKKKFLE